MPVILIYPMRRAQRSIIKLVYRQGDLRRKIRKQDVPICMLGTMYIRKDLCHFPLTSLSFSRAARRNEDAV